MLRRCLSCRDEGSCGFRWSGQLVLPPSRPARAEESSVLSQCDGCGWRLTYKANALSVMTVPKVEERNLELETKFAELTKFNLEYQRTERELRGELANSVSKATSDADRKRITELEKTEAKLRIEASKLNLMKRPSSLNSTSTSSPSS
ncbi:Centrosomal protein of 290 kDa [Triplophysa tibetana]|uniref:Centrosomal protein of 290 kDa n=1 Tax=Triplophysa tibetana TaxID=1572043 RepID=A0A5A9N7E1_9TELE|nr:Centrosomal protein of 290 kDa [Triplophysa tibetana]